MGIWAWRLPINLGVYAVWRLSYSYHQVEGVVGAHQDQVFLEELSVDVLPPVLTGVCVVLGGGVGDDNGLPRIGARVYRHGC